MKRFQFENKLCNMPAFHSLTTWQEHLKERALSYLTISGALIFDGQTFRLDDDWKTKVHESQYFWLVFSAGVEMWVKVMLLKHDVLQLRRRQAKHDPAIDNNVNHALRAALFPQVQSSNPHINNELQTKNIRALWEIDTLALGAVASNKGVDKLIAKTVMTQFDGDLLKQRLHCFAFIRRNVEAHIFLGSSTVEIGKDMSSVYLPMLNQLASLL